MNLFLLALSDLTRLAEMKIKRAKKVSKTLEFFRNNFGFRAPYQVLLVSWTPGHLDPWSPGHLVSWTPGLLDTWSLGHLVSWSPGHLVT